MITRRSLLAGIGSVAAIAAAGPRLPAIAETIVVGLDVGAADDFTVIAFRRFQLDEIARIFCIPRHLLEKHVALTESRRRYAAKMPLAVDG
jgi:hypothetical protein